MPTESFLPPGVQPAAPSTGQCFSEGCRICMSRGLSFSRGAGAAQGVEAPDRKPGDEAVGPTLPVGALPFCGRPSSLSSPTEGYSHRSQHVSLPWFGECDKTGASGPDELEGLPSWRLREYPGMRQDTAWTAPCLGRPSQSRDRSGSDPQTAPTLLPLTALKV